MRLASGHKGLGLHGMSQIAEIPECWGMHGVSRSGLLESAARRLRRAESIDTSSSKAQNLRQVLARPDIIEQGGVLIIRPLLYFSKERLTETCRAQALQWEEDMTNNDIWRTPRNNIRTLLRSAKLPKSLQKQPLLQLAKRIQDHRSRLHMFMIDIMARCEILLLDIRCGGLIVRFVRTSGNGEKEEGQSRAYMRNSQFIAMMLLKRIVHIVTPQAEVPSQSLVNAARSIFPDLVDRDSPDYSTFQPTSFTACGVHFQRLHFPLARPQSELEPANAGNWEVLDPSFVWKLTRQPFSKAPLSLTVQPFAKTECIVEETLSPWSSWQLWDGRYWIRLLNRSCQVLTIRSFQISDLQYLRSILSPKRYKGFHQLLRLAAPGKVRWTLPAVAEIRGDCMPMGRLLALPTLGKAGAFDTEDADGTNKVESQVRYKRVSLGYHISHDARSKIRRNKNLITSWLD